MLKVYTMQLSKTRGCNKKILNISTRSEQPLGLKFSPDWAEVIKYKYKGGSWEDYTVAYLKKMRSLYKKDKRAFDEVLGMEEIVLVCFCPPYENCHRFLLAEVLVKLGAEYGGELK